jgi:hypothetical protein
MYTLYKTQLDGERTVIAYCDSMTEGAQAIEADAETFRDCATYELIREDADGRSGKSDQENEASA